MVKGIEQLTGWYLPLADEITTGKGGITVCFAEDACIFTEPPEPQKDEFHVFDREQFLYAVLTSVQSTLQHWANPTNPESVDVYYAMGDNQPIRFDDLGVTWQSLEQPYSQSALEKLIHP